jgi:predicted ferric reductase
VLAATSLEWYVARAGGLVAFGLLTLSAVLGLALAGRVQAVRWPRFAIEDVHGFAGKLAGAFIAVHVLGLLLDDYVPFSPADVVVPGIAPYRPLPTALGVVAAEVLAALALTNRYRTRLPYRTWRRAHYLSFAVWSLALVHGITAGSDRTAAWATAFYALSVAAVASAGTWRALRLVPQPSSR